MITIPKTPGYWMAVGAHGSQLYGGAPYAEAHLREVVANLITYGFDTPDWIEAGWLHDAVEDTIKNENPLTIDIVRQHFGDLTANLVWAVSGMGERRRDRIADMHRKVIEFPQAAILKTADRIHNMESAKLLPDQGLYRMYLKEFSAFVGLVEGTGLVPVEMIARLYRAAA